MNLDIILAIVFYAFLIIYFFKNREKFQVQGKIFAMYKTKLGLKFMDKIAKKFKFPLKILAGLSIFTGFAGMILIFYFLAKGTIELILLPGTAPAVAPVLPGIKVMPGLPVLSFLHWIIAIFIVAVIHEFSHGIYARYHNIKIKSSGFAFLGPILAAFVEPDEKIMSKKSKKAQLAVFSAGPFSNILTGFIFMAILSFVTMPLLTTAYDDVGINVNTLIDGYPMQETGIETPFTITSINGVDVLNSEQFVNVTKEVTPGQTITLGTDKGSYDVKTVENPDNASKGFIGITGFEIERTPNKEIVDKYTSYLPPFIEWLHMLMFWLWIVSIGIGLFNLLPLGPVDGGRMFLTGLLAVVKDEKKAKKYWSIISFTCLLLIFINLAPYLWKLLLFISKPLILLFSLV